MNVTATCMSYLLGAEQWVPTTVRLGYTMTDPFSLTFSFAGKTPPIVWLVSRELVHTGLTRPTGQGDVRVWPSRTESDALFLHLSTADSDAILELSRHAVSEFLDRTAFLVAFGAEAMTSLDDELRELLGGESAA